MAFSAPTPFAGTLSENTLERSVQSGLVGEATVARNFCECQPRVQQEVFYRIYATFHKPAMRGPPKSPPESMGEMAYR
jgi:hypothetical protein